MSTGAAVALGAGAGIVGGLVVADAIQDAQEEAYAEGMSRFHPMQPCFSR